MGSREREPSPARHQPHLSSLVVRPSESGGGSDYEPGEVRRDPPPYSRSDRFHETPGNGKCAGSVSPLRHRKVDHHYRDDFGGPHHVRCVRGGRGPGRGRFRDLSPPYGRGRGGGRFSGRGFDGSGFDHGPFRNEGMSRNNPNVPPREGDWFCPDPLCDNLNFAKRDFCNKCNRSRIRPRDSPPRNFPGPPPRFAGPPMDRSPDRSMNSYRSPPPRSWARDGPREFSPPHPRHGGRFPDYHLRHERPDYREEDDYRDRGRFDRPLPPERGLRDRERRSYGLRNERRPLSPLSPPPFTSHGQWGRDMRGRSRSPMRSGRTATPPKDRPRDSFVDRGRDNRWRMARDRFDDHPY